MKKILLALQISILLIGPNSMFGAGNESLNTDKYNNYTENPFLDVSNTNLYFDAVNYLSSNGIIRGYEDGTFRPLKLLNRAELLKVTVLAKYSTEYVQAYGNKECFPDVNANEWYSVYVCFAKDYGIIEGYPDGSFRPEKSVNFVEGIKIVTKTFNYEYNNSMPWYKDLVVDASEKNFIPLNIIDFDQKLNRGQIADTISRVIHFQNDNLDSYLGDTVNIKQTYEDIENEVDNIHYYWKYLLEKNNIEEAELKNLYVYEEDYEQKNHEISLYCKSPCPIEKDILDKKFVGMLGAMESVKEYYNTDLISENLPIKFHLNSNDICSSDNILEPEIKIIDNQINICLYEYEQTQLGLLKYPLNAENAAKIDNQLLVMTSLTRVMFHDKKDNYEKKIVYVPKEKTQELSIKGGGALGFSNVPSKVEPKTNTIDEAKIRECILK